MLLAVENGGEVPVKHPELCPVCQGSGKIRPDNPAHPNFGLDMSTAVNYLPQKCHGCAEYGSKGWIVIGEDDPPTVITGSGETLRFVYPGKVVSIGQREDLVISDDDNA